MSFDARALMPRPIKDLLRPTYYALKGVADLHSLKKDFRSHYGPGFVFEVDERDVMFRYYRDLWCGGLPSSESRYRYLKTSAHLLSTVEDVLERSGVSLDQLGSFLDFASGHGRLTRFLVHRLSPDRITVSDINKAAVDFVRRAFGVRGFYSVAAPEHLNHDGRYDVIFVCSLFSHLPLNTWASWLSKLYSLLTPNGVLVFSTHSVNSCDDLPPGEHQKLETGEEGFLFSDITYGDLPPEIYGTTYVSEGYVRRVVASHALGKLIGFYPNGMSGVQDVYVIARSSSRKPDVSTS
jgi:SAM-dependent methyltransferase